MNAVVYKYNILFYIVIMKYKFCLRAFSCFSLLPAELVTTHFLEQSMYLYGKNFGISKVSVAGNPGFKRLQLAFHLWWKKYIINTVCHEIFTYQFVLHSWTPFSQAKIFLKWILVSYF